MVPISIEKFAELHVKSNKDIKKKDIIERLREAVERKKNGARYQICGRPIWAIGSAITFDGCFTCITGEADDSEDYEINEVI